MSCTGARDTPGALERAEASSADAHTSKAWVSKGPERRTVRSKPLDAFQNAETQLPLSSQLSDEQLLSLVCVGNTEALVFLFRRHSRIVRGIAYRVLRDRAEADDLLQDVFLLIQRLCMNFEASKGSARHWILQMAYRRAISRRRYLTSRRFYQWVDVDEAGELRDPHLEVDRLNDRVDGALRVSALEEAFGNLSEDQRQTLRLYFFEGYTLDEIATKLGQSKGNVKHHYFRGLERLRKHIFAGKLSSKGAV